MKKILKKTAKFIILCFICFVVLSICWVLLYRWVNPPVTSLMIARKIEARKSGQLLCIQHEWADFYKISPFIKKAVIAAEDWKFYKHHGFDFEAIKDAYDRNQTESRLRGGSTISQQTAKNVFLWSGRSYFRKALEAWFTILIEIFWGKERILEVYLNIIEMGNGIFGIEMAAQNYYRRPASELNKNESAMIAAVLPNPRKFSPLHPTNYIYKKQQRILGLIK